MPTLKLIEERPGVVSTELAAALGQERFAFKDSVRKLKALGLTISLDVGYRLTPRGEAYLKRFG
jgi:Mn-dependent DtxR family transcriptional regulator